MTRPTVYVVEGSEDGVIDIFRSANKAVARAREYCGLPQDEAAVKASTRIVQKDWYIMFNQVQIDGTGYASVERWLIK